MRLKEAKMARKRWVRLWTHETLYGTTSKELLPDERCIWFSFLALAGESPVEGVVCIAHGMAYTDKQLAQLLNCPLDLVQRAKDKMLQFEKIRVDGNETIEIVNWQKYQSEYSRTKQYLPQPTKASTRKSTRKSTPRAEVEEEEEEKKSRREGELAAAALPSAIKSAYENAFGMLTPISHKEVLEACGIYSEEWVLDAIQEAVSYGAKGFRYVVRILERWAKDGRQDDKKEQPGEKPEDSPEQFFKRYGHLMKKQVSND